MINKRIRIVIFLACFFLSVYSSIAQQKVTFKDGASFTISGNKIAEHIEYEENKVPRKLHQVYFDQKDSIYQLIIYSTWQTTNIKGNLDELRVYSFTKSQLDSNPEFYEQTDDNDVVTHYMLRLVAKYENPFNYQVYNVYSGTPKNKSFGTADFDSDIKTAFDEVIRLLQVVETEE